MCDGRPVPTERGRPFPKRALSLLALVPFFAVAGETVEVSIENYRFEPAEIRIRSGDTVKWVNREKRTSHSIHFAAEGLPESERLFPDESWQRSFAQAGEYPYVCGPHPEMKGVVRVAE